MSIIERVVDLLGSVPRANHEPSVARKGTEAPGPDLLERVTADEGRQSRSSDAKDVATGAKLDVRPASTGKAMRVHAVDLERLRNQSIITPDGERTPVAESFRRIKRHILANVADPKAGPLANLVQVTSASAGEGKTFCATNLAISISLELDHSVLLVDADVAKPSIPDVLGLAAEKGLLDVLRDHRIDLAEVLVKIDIGKLTLLPAGTAHLQATELLASDAMHILLRELSSRYRNRIIIFDSPPILAASESGALANQVGQIVLVVESGKTTESALKESLSRIDSRKVISLLLNKGEDRGPGYSYGSYGYGAT